MGIEKSLTSLTPAAWTNTNNTLTVSAELAHYLKSAAYKESSHPDASQISSATLRAQLSGDCAPF